MSVVARAAQGGGVFIVRVICRSNTRDFFGDREALDELHSEQNCERAASLRRAHGGVVRSSGRSNLSGVAKEETELQREEGRPSESTA